MSNDPSYKKVNRPTKATVLQKANPTYKKQIRPTKSNRPTKCQIKVSKNHQKNKQTNNKNRPLKVLSEMSYKSKTTLQNIKQELAKNH